MFWSKQITKFVNYQSDMVDTLGASLRLDITSHINAFGRAIKFSITIPKHQRFVKQEFPCWIDQAKQRRIVMHILSGIIPSSNDVCVSGKP